MATAISMAPVPIGMQSRRSVVEVLLGFFPATTSPMVAVMFRSEILPASFSSFRASRCRHCPM